MTPTEQTSLDIIEPPTTTITLNGIAYEITPLRVGQIPAFTKAARPLIEALNGMAAALEPTTIAGMIADHGDALIDAVAVAAKVPRAAIEQAEPDEFLEAALTVLQVNKDFFINRLLPTITRVAGAVTTGGGQTPSKP